jgi:hypothetical protein
MHRFVAASSTGNEGDFALHWSIGTSYVIGICMNFDNIAKGGAEAGNRFDNDVFRRVDELFHFGGGEKIKLAEFPLREASKRHEAS